MFQIFFTFCSSLLTFFMGQSTIYAFKFNSLFFKFSERVSGAGCHSTTSRSTLRTHLIGVQYTGAHVLTFVRVKSLKPAFMTYESIKRYFQSNPNFNCGKKSIDHDTLPCVDFLLPVISFFSKSIKLNEIITSDMVGDKEGFLNKEFIQLLYAK